ncbi:MAG TPA: DUF481 domain-containing protein [Luteimonas sp.]|nr:DUF481 domain-containing protein [Luteimonas sp.]
MLAAWWLAIAGLPLFHLPLPESPGEPSVLAIAGGRASMRMPCYALTCADADWATAPGAVVPVRAQAPGQAQPLSAPRLATIAARRYPLYSPASRRDWLATRADDARVDTRYGFDAVRTPDTQVQMEFGTGYRLQPYVDHGTAVEGPIASGRVALTRSLSDGAELTQQVQVETGRANTLLRQTLGVDLDVAPDWVLRSNFELRHDSAGDGGRGTTDTEGTLELRRAF